MVMTVTNEDTTYIGQKYFFNEINCGFLTHKLIFRYKNWIRKQVNKKMLNT